MRDCITAIGQAVRIRGTLTMPVMPSRRPAAPAAGPVNVLFIDALSDRMEHGLAAQKPTVTADASDVPAKVPALIETAK